MLSEFLIIAKSRVSVLYLVIPSFTVRTVEGVFVFALDSGIDFATEAVVTYGEC